MQKLLSKVVARQATENVDIDSFFVNSISADGVARYEFAKNYCEGKCVLDIACGHGYGSIILSSIAKKVNGVDVDSKTVKNAKHKYNNANLIFECSDGIEYLATCGKTFDTIVCFDTIEHIAEYKKFIKLAKNSLKPGGKMIVATPNKIFSDVLTGGTSNPFHVHEFYTEELVDLMKSQFTNVEHFIQRPVKTRDRNLPLFTGSLFAFLFGKSEVIKHREGMQGIIDIFICD